MLEQSLIQLMAKEGPLAILLVVVLIFSWKLIMYVLQSNKTREERWAATIAEVQERCDAREDKLQSVISSLVERLGVVDETRDDVKQIKAALRDKGITLRKDE